MSELTINTTQNVTINFTAANIGQRIGANLLDLAIKIAYIIVISYIFFDVLGISNFLDTTDSWSAIAVVLLFFSPVIAYTLVLESFWEGQTVGKKLLKIKVVKIDGYQASFGEYLIRWLFKLVDDYIMFGSIGLITMITNKKNQRLGDMAAGTAVITLKNKITISNTILEFIGEEYQPIYPSVIKLSDNDMRIIKDTYLLAKSKNDLDTIAKLKNKIESVAEIKNQSGSNSDFIKTVLKDYNYYTQGM